VDGTGGRADRGAMAKDVPEVRADIRGEIRSGRIRPRSIYRFLDARSRRSATNPFPPLS
jgi:hypothetical protein